MSNWTYDISRHSLEELLAEMGERGYSASEPLPKVLLCDSQGECFFDDAPDPFRETVIALLNERGAQGWELVQLIFRDRDMLAFWKKATN